MKYLNEEGAKIVNDLLYDKTIEDRVKNNGTLKKEIYLYEKDDLKKYTDNDDSFDFSGYDIFVFNNYDFGSYKLDGCRIIGFGTKISGYFNNVIEIRNCTANSFGSCSNLINCYGNTFSKCTNLTNCYGNTFDNCSNLNSCSGIGDVFYSDEQDNINYNASFTNCSNLTNCYGNIFDSCTNLMFCAGYQYYNCYQVSMCNAVDKSINNTDYCFKDCTDMSYCFIATKKFMNFKYTDEFTDYQIRDNFLKKSNHYENCEYVFHIRDLIKTELLANNDPYSGFCR